MEGRVEELKSKLARLLKEAAEVSVTLDRADGTIRSARGFLLAGQPKKILSSLLVR